jgi:phosphonate transport system substrate-binding protein
MIRSARVAWALCLAIAAGCRARAPEPNADKTERAIKPVETFETVNAPPHLILGLLPVFEPEQIRETYGPLAAYLGEQLGTKIEIATTDTYAQMIDMVAKREVDLVQLAPLSYVVAKGRDKSLDLLATNIAEGSSTYSGYILTRTDSPIHAAADFRGRRFGFVALDSSSGYLYPYAFFLEAGLLPERDFKVMVMTKRHDLAIEALLKGEVDGVATFSGALLNAESKGLDTEQVRILAKTGRIPYDAWCARGTLDAALRRKIQHALLSLSTRTPLGRKILGPLRSINGFAAASDATYDEIRRLKTLVDAARD